MDQLANYFEKFGNTFLVAALIPSLAFTSSLLFIFDPILPSSFRTRFYGVEDPLLQAGLGIALVTIILGFTLTSLNTFIFKVFEGYVLIQRLPFLKRRQIKKARVFKKKIALTSRAIARLEGLNSPSAVRRLEKLKNIRHDLLVAYDESFPHNEAEIMPTPFGNILKAAETYPQSRYGIDGVPFWPRLIHVIPDRYFGFIDKDANQLSFLMNCAILSFFMVLLSILAAGYQFLLSHYSVVGGKPIYFIEVTLTEAIYQQRAILYLLGAFIAVLFGIVFIRASLLILKDYGSLIRAAYDLFRTDLLKQLNFELPASTKEDYDHWGAISEFFSIGNPNGDLVLDYHYWSQKEKAD